MLPSPLDSLLATKGIGMPAEREKLEFGWSVVTAACKNHFPGVQLLYNSLVAMHTHVSLYVFDAGWTEEQRAWADKQPGIKVIEWQWSGEHDLSYSKPYFVQRVAGSNQKVVWIDADCIIRMPITAIFKHLDKKPFILTNQFCTPNDRSLYNINDFGDCSTRENFSITTGVIGFLLSRDADIISEWIEATEVVVANNAFESLSGMRDEGIFRAVVQKLELFEDIWWDVRWNAIHHDSKTRNSLMQSLNTLRVGDYITHFFGYPKIWQSTGLEVLDINPHWRYSHV